jgi:hypothetical protein
MSETRREDASPDADLGFDALGVPPILVRSLAASHELLVSVEENSLIGGAGAIVGERTARQFAHFVGAAHASSLPLGEAATWRAWNSRQGASDSG